MFVLGISCYFHDSAAALIKDGILVAAAEEERFTRKKHDYSFPDNAIDYCLRAAGISGSDVDYVVFFEKPFLKFERILLTAINEFPHSINLFRESMATWLIEKLWIKGLIREKTKLTNNAEVLFSWHHISHAASSFFCSPFEEAAILTADGVGEWATTTTGWGKDNKIFINKEIFFPHSIGLLYSTFTSFCGFEINHGEYKLMGLASYGSPRYVDKIWKLVKVNRDGSFQLNMDYFSFQYSTTSMFNSKFTNLFGQPRNVMYTSNIDQIYADLAASVQFVLEQILFGIATKLHEETGMTNLCLAGGVALNSVANGKMIRNTPFDEIYIQPASGDGGGALGAAFYAYHVLLNKPRHFLMEHAYWGEEYTPSEIVKDLKQKGIPFTEIHSEDQLVDMSVNFLKDQKVIGWFQGRFEYGPRALGNRSILADPRTPTMKDRVNSKVKFREPFRPFAPSVLSDYLGDCFSVPEAHHDYPLRFMQYVVEVNDAFKDRIPSVVHVDGTSRPHLVKETDNKRYYDLIKGFNDSEGIPMILNTSFNLRDEPIVNSPVDAINSFIKSDIDILVVDRFVLDKQIGFTGSKQ